MLLVLVVILLVGVLGLLGGRYVTLHALRSRLASCSSAANAELRVCPIVRFSSSFSLKRDRLLARCRWVCTDKELARLLLVEFYSHPRSERSHAAYHRLLELDRRRRGMDFMCTWQPHFDARGNLTCVTWNLMYVKFDYWGLERPEQFFAQEASIPWVVLNRDVDLVGKPGVIWISVPSENGAYPKE